MKWILLIGLCILLVACGSGQDDIYVYEFDLDDLQEAEFNSSLLDGLEEYHSMDNNTYYTFEKKEVK